MINFLEKHMRIIFVLLIIAFMGSTFAGLGLYFLNFKTDYIIKINNSKISTKLFNSIYTNSVKLYQKMTNKQLSEKDLNKIKMIILQTLVQNEIFYQQSKYYGIAVSDKELKTYLQNLKIFKNNGRFSLKKYHMFLGSLQMMPKEYETLVKKQIAGNKMKAIISSSIKLWNYELKEATKQNALPLTVLKDILIQKKVSYILNEWYLNIIKNSKITSNDSIFIK
jgi:hypothetical protein